MQHVAYYRNSRSGVALLTALFFLGLFSMLGTAYLAYTMVEWDTSTVELNNRRARYYESDTGHWRFFWLTKAYDPC